MARSFSFFCVLILLVAGCSHMTIHRADPGHATGAHLSLRVDSFLFAIVNSTAIPPEREICPQSRIETLDLHMTPTDVGLSVVTLGLYIPHHVEITCGEKISGL